MVETRAANSTSASRASLFTSSTVTSLRKWGFAGSGVSVTDRGPSNGVARAATTLRAGRTAYARGGLGQPFVESFKRYGDSGHRSGRSYV